MSAHFANSAAFVSARTASPRRAPARSTISNPLSAAMQWMMDLPRRRAVINELEALSDHELADIGLSRADVRHVFDRDFAPRGA